MPPGVAQFNQSYADNEMLMICSNGLSNNLLLQADLSEVYSLLTAEEHSVLMSAN